MQLGQRPEATLQGWRGRGPISPGLGVLMTRPTEEIRRHWDRLIARGDPPSEWQIPIDVAPPQRFEDEDRKPAIVCSFMRSGTHFLMGTMAKNFGFIADPWLAIEHAPINFFYQRSVDRLFQLIANRRYRNIAQSHHSVEFLANSIEKCEGAIQVLYIYRHPAYCLNSYRKFLPTWPGIDAAGCDDIVEFMQAKPAPHHAKLSWTLPETMLDYWADHVRGWLQLAEQNKTIHVVRYEDLAGDFSNQVRRMACFMGLDCETPKPPDRSSYITAGPLASPAAEQRGWLAHANAYIEDRHPGLMAALGYAAERDSTSMQSA